jgi:hypothetical protein
MGMGVQMLTVTVAQCLRSEGTGSLAGEVFTQSAPAA